MECDVYCFFFFFSKKRTCVQLLCVVFVFFSCHSLGDRFLIYLTLRANKVLLHSHFCHITVLYRYHVRFRYFRKSKRIMWHPCRLIATLFLLTVSIILLTLFSSRTILNIKWNNLIACCVSFFSSLASIVFDNRIANCKIIRTIYYLQSHFLSSLHTLHE